MRNAGRVVSKTMIMEHVWDYNFDPQTNIIEARVCRLRDKIDNDFKSQGLEQVKLNMREAIEEEETNRVFYRMLTPTLNIVVTSDPIKWPLTRIRALAEASLDHQDIDGYQESIGTIVEECDRLTYMINTMLEIAEVDAGLRKSDLAADRSRIFEKFYRVESSRSMPGHGSTFTVKITKM